jgi:alpha-1,2-mannosyltransferase
VPLDCSEDPANLRRRVRRVVWTSWVLILGAAAILYAQKAAEDRSAFLRWRHQVLELLHDGNIAVYEAMMFPNPPIMPISLYPLMLLPPLVGALAWFAIKCGLATIAAVLCFRMARDPDRRLPGWAEGLILFLSLRPILSDLHHGNINLMILFLVVVTLYAWRQGRDIVAGLTLALAISYKVTPALFIPYFFYKGSWRTVLWTFLGMGIFLLIVPSVVLGLTFNAECLAMWWHRILSPYLIAGQATDQEMNQSMVGVLTRLLTEGPVASGRYDRHVAVHLIAGDPRIVNWVIKAISVVLVGLLALFCRTQTQRRDDPRMLGEFALVVLTMLFVSERSWKHHYVTVLLPFTYLVYRLTLPTLARAARWTIAAALGLSALMMASTSSEVGGLLLEEGHKLAQGYGLFFWAGVVLYATTAWRVVVEGRIGAEVDRPANAPIAGHEAALRQPHITAGAPRSVPS